MKLKYVARGRLMACAVATLLAIPDAQAKTPALGPLASLAQSQGIDLSIQEEPGLRASTQHQLANAWFENLRITGFGAAGFIDSGDAGTRPNGGFLVKETSLFIEADTWENSSLFFELQVNRLGKDNSVATRTGEVYLRFDELLGDCVGLKLGRVDIPFGEEYLWQDSIDNPLVTQSAPYPYGFDEGVVLYGDFNESTGWVASITDGTDERSIEDDSAKAITAKVYGDVTGELYVSTSFMVNGDAGKSALEFGGSHFQPVGAGGTSSAGASSSTVVDAYLGQVDLVYEPTDQARLALFYGMAKVDDDDDSFDRELAWFMLGPFYQLNSKWYTLLRYSEIGTYDDDEGYHFDGKVLAGGNSAFGYDAKSLRRLSGGVGWLPNPHTRVKFELGQDWFDLIDASPLDDGNDERFYLALEIVLSF